MLSFFSPLYIYMIGGSRVVTGLLLKTRVAFNCETIEREKKKRALSKYASKSW